MKLQYNGSEVYASTGGKDHISDQEYLIFLHGAGSSHLVWSQQSRSFAYGGYNVLSIDFPGHNLSGGKSLGSIEEQAVWLKGLMDHLEIEKASIIGHSQGGLVALELAHQHPECVDKIAFVATAATIPVNEMLISTAETKEPNAKASMTAWSHGPDAHHFDNKVPGFSNIGMNIRIMDMNPEGSLPDDLKACDAYEGGLEKASKIGCPTLCVLAGRDKMTPLKFGKQLAEALPNNTLHVFPKCGHAIPGENPIELNEHLRNFLSA